MAVFRLHIDLQRAQVSLLGELSPADPRRLESVAGRWDRRRSKTAGFDPVRLERALGQSEEEFGWLPEFWLPQPSPWVPTPARSQEHTLGRAI